MSSFTENELAYVHGERRLARIAASAPMAYRTCAQAD